MWIRSLKRRPPTRHSDRTVVVFGSGRSGTTWLAQIIAAGGLELIFEPLHEVEVPEAGRWQPHPLYLPRGAESPWEDFMGRALAGEVRSRWTIRANQGASRKVVKFIRANLLAHWMVDRFDIDPVFIIRNPLAVVSSMREQGWHLAEEFIRTTVNSDRLAEFLEPFRDLVERPLADVELYALLWCIQSFVPQEQGVLEHSDLVVYEELCREPRRVIDHLLPRLGIEVDRGVRRQVRRQSLMTGRRRTRGRYDPTTAWREKLSLEEVRQVVQVVERFRLDRFILDA